MPNTQMKYVQCQHNDSLPAIGLQRQSADMLCSKFSICNSVLHFQYVPDEGKATKALLSSAGASRCTECRGST